MIDTLASLLLLAAWVCLVWLVLAATVAPGHIVIVWRWAKQTWKRIIKAWLELWYNKSA